MLVPFVCLSSTVLQMETVVDLPQGIALLNKRQGGMAEPLDCSTPALDLCVRRRPRSPTPEGAFYHQTTTSAPQVQETPSSTMYFSSPGSHADSESSETSISSDPMRDFTPYTFTGVNRPKVTRPFKAYPKDPLSLAVGVATAEAILGKDSAEAYAEFRKRMLSQVQQTHCATNKNMRRNTICSNNPLSADPSYWEKRRKNNEAAKRSRDARRAKEDEIAIRCAFLEQENMKLRYEVAALRDETERLRSMIYN